MLKTISAALLAVSVLAAPALAATPGKTTHAPVIKSEQVKPNVLNANARMGRHHHRHYSHRHFHKHMGALKTHRVSKLNTHQLSKATIKRVAPAAPRGYQARPARHCFPNGRGPVLSFPADPQSRPDRRDANSLSWPDGLGFAGT